MNAINTNFIPSAISDNTPSFAQINKTTCFSILMDYITGDLKNINSIQKAKKIQKYRELKLQNAYNFTRKL